MAFINFYQKGSAILINKKNEVLQLVYERVKKQDFIWCENIFGCTFRDFYWFIFVRFVRVCECDYNSYY